QREFLGGIVVIDVADIGAEQDFSSGPRISAEFGDHLRDPGVALLVGSVTFAGLDVEERKGGNQRQIRFLEAGDERRVPWRRIGNRVREDIDSTLDGNVHTFRILRMREHGQAVAACLDDRSPSDRKRQRFDLPARLKGAGKQLNAVPTLRGMVAHQGDRLFWRFSARYGDVVRVQKITDVDRFTRPDRFADGQNAWATKL